ncbi:hypothetical protein CVT25_012155 [Psilocybe cyanescens]|uniref:BZIP domain-containing protein n=1 Tax=Psilocybe cyanescens TaxID=93625 RepID=A0A409XJ82_PSICY|nr:hypothetical protein CVT25_012155 [Psilocybe cyanescens]
MPAPIDEEQRQNNLKIKREYRCEKRSSPEELSLEKEQHRQAQARYREKNRLRLNFCSRRYRLEKKHAQQLEQDEEEYQRLMALGDED